MVTVIIKKTGEIQTVEKNIAHDLIERGIAKLYKPTAEKSSYSSRQMRPSKP